jgi:hypothetical protein
MIEFDPHEGVLLNNETPQCFDAYTAHPMATIADGPLATA